MRFRWRAARKTPRVAGAASERLAAAVMAGICIALALICLSLALTWKRQQDQLECFKLYAAAELKVGTDCDL